MSGKISLFTYGSFYFQYFAVLIQFLFSRDSSFLRTFHALQSRAVIQQRRRRRDGCRCAAAGCGHVRGCPKRRQRLGERCTCVLRYCRSSENICVAAKHNVSKAMRDRRAERTWRRAQTRPPRAEPKREWSALPLYVVPLVACRCCYRLAHPGFGLVILKTFDVTYLTIDIDW